MSPQCARSAEFMLRLDCWKAHPLFPSCSSCAVLVSVARLAATASCQRAAGTTTRRRRPSLLPSLCVLLSLLTFSTALRLGPAVWRTRPGLTSTVARVVQSRHRGVATMFSALPRMQGELFCYYQDEFVKRVGFKTGSHKRHVVLIGGLSDGLLPVPYTTQLAEALEARGWSLVQVLMSSSYTGFGHCTLQTDCDDLDKLLNYLEQQEGSEAVGMVGHSTGCQDAVYFLKHGKHTSRVRFIALQAPVSDREHLSMLPNTDTLIGLAKAFVQEGNGEEMMPRAACWAPVTAKRYLDLATKEGLDDMFSSDLTGEELGQRLGHVSVPTLLAFSAADEYVPPTVDVPALAERMRAAIAGRPCEALHLEGAKHSLRGYEDMFVTELLGFMDRAGLP